MKQGWEITNIGSIADITDYVANGSFATLRENVSYLNDNGYAILVRLADYTNKFDKGKFVYIDEHAYDFLSKSKLFGGEIIMSNVGSIGKSFICPDLGMPMSLAPNSIVIRTSNNPFYHYLFQSDYFQTELRAISSQTALPKFNKTSFKKINVPVPPIAEQEKIVAELDCLSGIIEKKKQQLKELDALAQSIFYEMFGDPVENEKRWEVKKLGEVCDVRDGTHDSPKYLEHSEYVLVTSKNITSDGDIDFTTANYISKEDYDAINKRSYVDFGDIIMAMIGTIGKPIIVKETSRKFCIKNVALIKFEESTSVTNTYIQALLSNNSYASYIQGNNKGGTQKFIALGTIRKLLTPIPPLTLQQDFACKIETIEKQKELIAQSIKETETLFNSRMDYYFN